MTSTFFILLIAILQVPCIFFLFELLFFLFPEKKKRKGAYLLPIPVVFVDEMVLLALMELPAMFIFQVQASNGVVGMAYMYALQSLIILAIVGLCSVIYWLVKIITQLFSQRFWIKIKDLVAIGTVILSVAAGFYYWFYLLPQLFD